MTAVPRSLSSLIFSPLRLSSSALITTLTPPLTSIPSFSGEIAWASLMGFSSMLSPVQLESCEGVFLMGFRVPSLLTPHILYLRIRSHCSFRTYPLYILISDQNQQGPRSSYLPSSSPSSSPPSSSPSFTSFPLHLLACHFLCLCFHQISRNGWLCPDVFTRLQDPHPTIFSRRNGFAGDSVP